MPQKRRRTAQQPTNPPPPFSFLSQRWCWSDFHSDWLSYSTQLEYPKLNFESLLYLIKNTDDTNTNELFPSISWIDLTKGICRSVKPMLDLRLTTKAEAKIYKFTFSFMHFSFNFNKVDTGFSGTIQKHRYLPKGCWWQGTII